MSRDLTFLMIGFAAALLVLLVISFSSRPRVFAQYLRILTGIRVTPAEIRHVHRQLGRAGVRELFLDLLIREDLADTNRVVTPDSKPDLSIFDNARR